MSLPPAPLFSEPLTITVETKATTAKKIAEVDIDFIRLGGSDEEIKNAFLSLTNSALQLSKTLSFTGGATLRAERPRLSQLNWCCWRCTLDIVAESSTPFAWSSIVKIIAATIVGAAIFYFIIYFVRIRPLEEATQIYSRTLTDILAELTKAFQQGLIDEETYTKIVNMITQAQREAQTAGSENWWEYLEKAFKLLPFVIAIIILLEVVRAVRR